MGEDTTLSPSTQTQSVIPLRTILRNFLNLVENCEAGRNTGLDLYDKEFQELKQFSESLKSDPDYQCKEGEKTVNKKKNRYKDILPFDFSRVALSDNGDNQGSDYVNANFIKGASGSSAYIACQGPLPHTVNDFWRMVVECEVQVIVMACMEHESGKHKCENYWVEEDGEERQFGDVTVWLKKCRNVCSDFLVRTMRIRFNNSKGEPEERNVCQFHYSAWPDHGVPTKVRPLLDMVRLIRDCQTSETLPVLVHCSAGCGRTGTICAIDYVWGLLRLGKLTPDFSLFKLVREMRRQRIAMVQTKDQYILVHRAVKELFQEQLKVIEAHPYANVDQNGLPFDIKYDLIEPIYDTIDYNAKVPPDVPVSSSKPSPSSDENDTLRSSKSDRTDCFLRIKERPKKEIESCYSYDNSDIPNETKSASSSPSSRTSSSNDKCKKNSPSSSSTIPEIPSKGNSLLRKPSIVKLKAFFEKTPKKANVTATGLSRAKSDVSSSSRFYSITSHLSSSKSQANGLFSSSSKNQDEAISKSAGPVSSVKEKLSKIKPPLFAKPVLPIKRSKSLKAPAGDNTTVQRIKLSDSITPVKAGANQTEVPKPTVLQSSDEAVLHVRKDSNESQRKSSLSRSESTDTSLTPPKKSSIPSKIHVYKDSHNYVNVGAKGKLNFSGTSDSQTKNETRNYKQHNGDTNQTGDVPDGGSSRTHSQLSGSEKVLINASIYSEVPASFNSGFISASRISGSGNAVKPSSSESEITKSNGAVLSPLLDKPNARKRMPKTNAYTNFPLDKFSTDPNPKHKSNYWATADSNRQLNHPNGPILNGTSNLNYSSDSSNSIPGTPTHSGDSNYPSLVRGNNSTQNFITASISNYTPPKSILKGSLSSTPSESDERLDRSSSYTAGNNTSVTTISNNNLSAKLISNIRIGVRERRNSFRQAVWKEAQSDPPYSQLQESPTYASVSTLGQNHSINNVEPSSKRTHKDYEPIWPSERDGSKPSLVPPFNSSSNTQSSSRSLTPYQSRVEDIKVLLEELRSPMSNSKVEESDNGSDVKVGAGKLNNLKYHRSLKAPSRSQYQNQQPGNSLSCFTFRKPSSLESITDQFHIEESKLSLANSRSAFNVFTKESERDTPSRPICSVPTSHHNPPPGKRPDDYVVLRQCRTAAVPQNGPSLTTDSASRNQFVQPTVNGHSFYQNHNFDQSYGTPKPPPRTKSKNRVQANDKRDNVRETTPESGEPGWKKTSLKSPHLNANGNNAESSGNTTGTSVPPKGFSRFTGMLQSFTNWADISRDKGNNNMHFNGQSKRDSGQVLLDEDDDDNGFSRVPPTYPISSSRGTKQQYL